MNYSNFSRRGSRPRGGNQSHQSLRSGSSSQGRSFASKSGGFSRNSRPTNRFGSGRRRPRTSLGSDINIFIKKAADITTTPAFVPTNNFSDFPIDETLKSNIVKHGYTQPTPIQDQSITPILSGRDLIGLANTGTGKTGAFLIPIIDKLFKDRHQNALIIAPTRELASQIHSELTQLAADMRIFSALIIGGANMYRQLQNLRREPQVVIATPGRLRDLIERRELYLSDFSTFVLDEVDLMVDIGFITDIKYFISLLPTQRQSLFFSATIPPKVAEILRVFVTDPITVSVKTSDTAQNIDQNIIRVINPHQKLDQLHDLLTQDGFSKVLIFGRTKHGIEKLHKELTFRGFKTGALHGNKRQGHRQRTLDSFKQNQIQILLATDVASRGLDIDNVTHVINYDLPESYDDYVHRIGRTGRANKPGIALTFVE